MVRGVADRCLAGREGNASGGNPLMHDHGKSDRLVLPAKLPNKPGEPGAEAVEERGLPEGNTASETRPGGCEHERNEEVRCRRSVCLMRCCNRRWRGWPGGLAVLRGRPVGGGRKPPQAAAVKSRGGERLRKSRAVSAAGVGQEGERKRSTDDVSKGFR
jgi:hypothetical protein